jgi:hypothetical protein
MTITAAWAIGPASKEERATTTNPIFQFRMMDAIARNRRAADVAPTRRAATAPSTHNRY